MNAVLISGNVVAKPEKVSYGKGKSAGTLVNFRMGNNERVNGESVSNGFFDVTAYGAQGENARKAFKKGTRIVVTGRLQHRTFDRPDGSKGGRTSIIASEVGVSVLFDEVKVVKKKA